VRLRAKKVLLLSGRGRQAEKENSREEAGKGKNLSIMERDGEDSLDGFSRQFGRNGPEDSDA